MNEYDAIVEGLNADDEGRLRRSFYAGGRMTPDAAASALELSAQTGVPGDVVARNADDVQAKADRDSIPYAAIARESPGLARWLAENPQHAALAKGDELAKLGALEWLFTAPGQAWRSGQAQVEFGAARSRAGAAPTPQQLEGLTAMRERMEAGGGALGAEHWWSRMLVSNIRQAPTLLAGFREFLRGGLPGGMAAGGAALALGQAGPQVALPEEIATVPLATAMGFAWGGRTSSAMFSFDQERGHALGEFDDIRDENGQPLDPRVAWMAANAAGALSAGLEVAGVEILLKSFPGLKGLGSRQAIGALLKVPTVRGALLDAAKSYGTTLGQEVGIEVAQRAVTILSREAAKLASEQQFAADSSPPILADLAQEGTEAFMSMTLLTAPGPVMQAGMATRSVQEAQRRADFFRAIGEVSAASGAATKAPAAVQGLVDRLTRNGPVTTVYAPLDGWNTYFQSQGIDPRQAAAELLGSTEVYDQVALAGGDLPIPTARYAARLAPTAHNGELARILRFAPDQMNLVEAEQFVKDAEALEAAVPAEADSVELIRQDVIGMLRQTGADQVLAESQAEVIASFYRTQAANMGLAPKALYDQFPLDVRGEIPEVLQKLGNVDLLDDLIDRVRRGERPTDGEVFGKSLTEFLAEKGGIQDQGGELRGMDANKSRTTQRRLVTDNGLLLDAAAEAAWEAGYIPEYDAALLLEAIDGELRGKPVYSAAQQDGERQQAARLRDAMDALNRELDAMGVDSIGTLTNEQLKAMLLAPQGDMTLEQPADGSARGQISFGAPVAGRRAFNIRLLERANRSTFLHESGHMFLEVLGDLVEREGATDQQRADYQTLLNWMGVKDRAGIQREQHEQFARGFEAYIMEGKAPSAGLRRMFSRFRSWLVALYRTAAGLNVELTDDVRKVMDRLLATEEEIKAAEAEANVEALLTAETAGMSATEFAAYQTLVADAGVQARDILMRRLVNELERETAKWWRVERDKIEEEVTREIDAMPGYRALAAIRRNELPDGLPRPAGVTTLKLDREALESRYGKATRPRGVLRAQAPEVGMLGAATRGAPTTAPATEVVPNTIMNRLRDLKVTRGEGLAPALAAELFGFRDVEEMVLTLVNLRPRKELIKAETDRRMREAFPDIRFDGSLADEAAAAVMNEKREEVLRAEIAALRRKQREIAPFVRAKQRAEGEQKRAGLSLIRSAVPDVATVRDVARRIIAGKRIRDLRPQDYLATARVQARMAVEAAARGDQEVKADPKRGLPGYESGWAWAADLKARELLNYHLYREALAAQGKVSKAQEYAARFQETATRARLGKAGADYLEQVDALLGRFNLKPISAKALQRKLALRDWLTQQQEQGVAIDLPEELVNEAFQKSYRELSVEEFLGIADSLKTIEHAARLKNKLLTAQGKREWAEAKAALLERIDGQKGRAPPVSPFDRTKVEALRDGALMLADILLRPETIVEWLDGGESGPWHEYFWELANQAEYRREQMRNAVLKPLHELTAGFDRARRAELVEKVNVTSLGRSLSRQTLISIALNMGNAGNRERLTRGGLLDRGERIALTDAALQEITGLLTTADWTLVQAMWDAVESLWPEARDLEERLTGLAPEKVEPTPITVDRGMATETYRGGYWPVVYDPFGSRAGEKQAEAGDAVDKLLGANFSRATTKKSHLKARSGVAGPLLLDFERVLGRHIGDVITDITHREFILQGLKILLDPDIKLRLLDAAGEASYASLNKMLRNTVHQDGDYSSTAERTINGLFQRALTNTVVAALGFKVATAVGNMFLAPIQAAARVSPRYIAVGFGRFYSSPRVMTAFINARSPMMEQRAGNMDATFVETLTRLRGEAGIRAQVARTAMAVHRWADAAVTRAVWLGRYEEALVAGETEAEAARLADKAIRQTQTAGAPKDLSDIESIPWVRKTGLTMFLGPMLIMGNRIREAAQLRGAVQSWPEALGTMLAVWFLPAVLWDIVSGKDAGGDDDDEWLDDAGWALRKIAFYPFLTVPLLRDAAAVAEARLDGKRVDARANPAVQAAMFAWEAGAEAAKAGGALWEGDDVDGEKLTKAALRASGPLVGLPTGQLMVTGEFLHDVMTGEYQPEGASEWRYLVVQRPRELRN